MVAAVDVCPACSFLVPRTDSGLLLPAHIDVRRGAWCAGSPRPTLGMRVAHLRGRWSSHLLP
jgi:hypothetical protein